MAELTNLLASVFALVSFEGVELSKCLVTHATFVGAVPSVEAYVDLVVGGVTERFPTLFTLVGFLS